MEISEYENPNRIEIKKRNELQHYIIVTMLGEQQHDPKAQLAWVATYRNRASAIIDDPENETIRLLVKEEKYAEAAALVIPMLLRSEQPAESETEELAEAA